MLPKINRLKKKRDFEAVFKTGSIFKNNILILRLVKNNLDKNRFGFMVSLKVSKKAVLRNKVRRRLSEIIKRSAGKIKTGTDMVFIALPGIEKKEFSEIDEAVKNILNKAKCLIS